MSWKATAYVKEITTNITPAEKLLFYTLADYHNTARRVAWPDIKTLAFESLMSERNAQRLLASLEKKGFIRRLVPSNQERAMRQTTLYEIPALDQAHDILSGGLRKAPDKAPDKNGQSTCQIRTRNKEERVEPVEPVEPVLGSANPNCTTCHGTGLRGSYSTPRKVEDCECTNPDAHWRSARYRAV